MPNTFISFYFLTKLYINEVISQKFPTRLWWILIFFPKTLSNGSNLAHIKERFSKTNKIHTYFKITSDHLRSIEITQLKQCLQQKCSIPWRSTQEYKDFCVPHFFWSSYLVRVKDICRDSQPLRTFERICWSENQMI